MLAKAAVPAVTIPKFSVLAALGRNLWWLAGVAILTGLIAFSAMSPTKPMFTSEAQLAILFSGSDSEMGGEHITAHVKALRSLALAERIIADLMLVSLAEFGGTPEGIAELPSLLRLFGVGSKGYGDNPEDRALARFARRLGVVALADRQTIAVRFSAHDPAMAAEIANRLIEVYRDHLASGHAGSDQRRAPVEARIVSRAQSAIEPTVAKPLPFAIAITVAMMLLCASLAITREMVVGPPIRSRKRGPPAAIGQLRPGVPRAAVGRPSRGEEANTVAPGDGIQEQADTIATLLERLLALRSGPRGVRSLLVGANTSIDPSAEAIDLARAIARQGASVVLIDWCLGRPGVAHLLGAPDSPGIAELISGRAGFGDTINRMAGSSAHLIVGGAEFDVVMAHCEADRVNLVLDTLDEIYDQILIVANYNVARDLFETIEGRFDAGITVGQPSMRLPSAIPSTGNFLGFEVEDLEVLRLVRTRPDASGRGKKSKSKAA